MLLPMQLADYLTAQTPDTTTYRTDLGVVHITKRKDGGAVVVATYVVEPLQLEHLVRLLVGA